jgi:glycine C-acetyltransferase
MTKAGFKINPGDHPIVPIMLGDAKVAVEMADGMLKEGVYVIAFSYPVVPKDKARIRVQISAALTIAELDKAIAAFSKIGKKLGII